MNKNKIPEPALPPLTPCDHCREHSTVSLGPSHGLFQATYCEHNQAGALLSRDSTTDYWRVYNPLSASDFADIVNRKTEIFMNDLTLAQEAVKRLTTKN